MYIIKMSFWNGNFKQSAVSFVTDPDFESLIKDLQINSEKKYFKLINNSVYNKTIKEKMNLKQIN